MEQYLKEFESALNAAVQKLENELRAVRGNRPSVQLVEDVKVNYYDQLLSVKQLGSLGVRPPREIEITVWDKNAVGPVSKAIEEAKIGFSVTSEGNAVKLTLPPLTEERRQEVVRLVKKIAEATRIQIRTKRDEIIKKIKAAEAEKKLDEDGVFRAKERIQKQIEEVNGKIERMVGEKLKELAE
jgi:ribosome recycling factor